MRERSERGEPRLVVQPWRELTVLLSVGIGSLVMLGTLFSLVMTLFDQFELPLLATASVVFGPSTCALGMYVSWRCVRKRRHQEEAASLCLSGALLAGGANVPLVALFIGLVTLTHPWLLLMSLVVGSMCGMILGCPLGFVFGAASLRPIKLGCSRPSSIDANDVTSQVCWGWLSTLSLICALLVGIALVVTRDRCEGIVVPALFGFIAIVSRWSAWRASRRGEHRRRFLHRVIHGQEPRWSVVSLDEIALASAASLPDLFYQERGAPSAVLVRHVETSGEGAYRKGEHYVPIALVKSS